MQLEVLPKKLKFLALALCAYLAAPLYDVPLTNLSLSAPLSFVLILEVSKLRGNLQLSRSKYLFLFIVTFNAALILSFAWNHLFTDNIQDFDEGLKYIIRFIYWAICSLMAFRIFACTNFPKSASQIIATALVVMSILILIEFLTLGGLQQNGWSHWTTMSQNGYAWQYSTFLPFVSYMFIVPQGKFKILWGIGLMLCIGAIIVLGSRSAWGITLFGLLLFLMLYVLALRSFTIISNVLLTLLVACVLAVIVWFIMPDYAKINVFSKIDTFEKLDRDKSWLIRQVQIQKGLLIFDDFPILGVGPGQFIHIDIPVDLPDALRGKSYQNYTNRSSHNSYIGLLAEGGIALISPFSLMLIWLTLAGSRAAIQLARFGETWGLALYSGFIGMSIHFWALSGITSTAPWFIYGMMAAMIYRARWMKRTVLAQRRRQFEDEVALGLPLPRPR